MNNPSLASFVRATVLILLLSAGSHSSGAETSDAVAAPPPESVLLFKSGQAFLQRRVPLDGGVAQRVLLPPSVHGSVWIDARRSSVKRAVSRFEQHPIRRDVRDLRDLLRRAVGRQVTLELAGEDRPQVTCRVLRLLETKDPEPRPATPGRIVPPIHPATHVAVEIGDRVQVLPVGRVNGLSFEPEVAGDWTYEEPTRSEVLEIELQDGAPDVVGLYNLAGGLAWAPSYVLDLGDDGKSRLRGIAVVVNDLEDLEETRVRLVIGFPNIEFAGVESALMPSVTLERLAGMLGGAGDRVQRGRTSVLLQQVATPAMSDEAARSAGGITELPGDTSEDLFVYDLGALDLAKGERAYVPLTEQTVEHEHRFDWMLPDTVTNDMFQQSGEPDAPPVWHVLKLENAGRAPWTTAPILILGERGPIAQSTLRYTPPGGDTRVQLTQALDIVGQASEVRADELQSERKTVQMFGRRYERVEVLGRLELDNRSRRAVPMHVAKSLSGDVVAADGSPEVVARAAGLGRVNASRTLIWEFELDAGAAWKREYRYTVLIRR